MPLWQWLLDTAGVVLLTIALFGVVLVVRRRVLSRHGGTFELSVRDADQPWARLGARPGSLPRGLLGLVPDLLAAPGAQAVVAPQRPDLLLPAVPRGDEEYALYAGHVVVVCATPKGEIELAMSPSSLTGLQSWLEAGPPGSRPSR